MAVAMTDVPVPIAVAPSAIWTSIYTSAGVTAIVVHNRGVGPLLVRLNGASTAATDALDAAAEILHPGASMPMTIASGDKVFARPLRDDQGAGRATVRA